MGPRSAAGRATVPGEIRFVGFVEEGDEEEEGGEMGESKIWVSLNAQRPRGRRRNGEQEQEARGKGAQEGRNGSSMADGMLTMDHRTPSKLVEDASVDYCSIVEYSA